MRKHFVIVNLFCIFFCIANYAKSNKISNYLKEKEIGPFNLVVYNDGRQEIQTPFAEVYSYSSDLFLDFSENHIKGIFTFLDWNRRKKVFTIRTSLGEKAVFSKTFNGWSYTNYLNDVIQEKESITWVGRYQAMHISREICFCKSEIKIENGKIIITENGFTRFENFFLPEDFEYKIIFDGKMMLVWDSYGYYFDEEYDFLNNKKSFKYFIIRPTLSGQTVYKEKIPILWHWMLGGTRSTFRDGKSFFRQRRAKILSKECSKKGKNRYDEVEIKSSTGKSTIFFNYEKNTTRLGRGWHRAGEIFSGKEFSFKEGGRIWRIKILNKTYTAIGELL